jgi:transcriptional regulator with XRE-family HTH domain
MTNPDALKIGARVAYLRDVHDPPLSQEDLAALADVSRSTVQNLELGRRMPHPKNLAKIARSLGVTLPELRGDDLRPLAETPELRAVAERLGRTPEEVARRLTSWRAS